MTLREILGRVFGEAGAAPVETELRPAEVAARVRSRRRKVLAVRSVATTAATALVAVAAYFGPGIALNQESGPPPAATGSHSHEPSERPKATTSPPAESQTPQSPAPSDAPEGDPGQTTSAPESPAAPQQDSIPRSAWDTAPKQFQGTATSQDPAALRSIEVGRHANYDRVVFEFAAERPAFEVSYGQPREPGSGRSVNLDSEHALAVTFRNVTRGSGDTKVLDSVSVSRVRHLGAFERVGAAAIGVKTSERVPFQAFTLSDPHRVVIDVAHGGSGGSGGSGGTQSPSPIGHQCKQVAFEENTDHGAFNIRARDLPCEMARQVAADAQNRGGSDYTSQGFTCVGRKDTDSQLTAWNYTCTRSSDENTRITFTAS